MGYGRPLLSLRCEHGACGFYLPPPLLLSTLRSALTVSLTPPSSGLRATVLVSSEIHCLVFVLASSSVVDVRLFGLHGYGIAGRRGVWRLSHAWNCQKMLGWSAMWSGDLTLPTTFFSCLMPPPPSQCGHICDNTAQGFIGVSCTSTLASPRVARFEPPASGLVSF
jgi:hypothetical protein